MSARVIGPRPAQERGTRMSKRDKRPSHHRPVQPLTSPEESRARVESLIASGKTREALDLAKQWFKETRSAEAEALVIAAYEARIAAMLAQGLYDEATALAALVGERFPAHRQRIAPLVSQSKAIAAGDLRALLAELAAAAPPRRREIEAILTRELRDPRLLADADALAADDPLRRAARRGVRSVRRGDERAAGRGRPRRAGPDPASLAAGAVEAPDPGARRVLPARGRGGARQPRRDSARTRRRRASCPCCAIWSASRGRSDQRSPAVGALIKAVSGGRIDAPASPAAPRPRPRGRRIRGRRSPPSSASCPRSSSSPRRSSGSSRPRSSGTGIG